MPYTLFCAQSGFRYFALLCTNRTETRDWGFIISVFAHTRPRLRVIKAGTEGGQGSEEVPITCHGHKTLPSHAAKIVRQLLTFVKKFGLEHPKLKQSGEQEEPLFMALIVKENLPLSTHRRPYLRFSEEARGPSGQSQLQPAQMRIDCSLESDYSPEQELETDGKDRSDLVLFQFLLTPK